MINTESMVNINIGEFKSAKNNLTTIKHIYNESTNVTRRS